MRTRFRPASREDQCNRGVMRLENADIPLPTKQSLAALRTNDVKTENTNHKISLALKHWPTGERVTQAGLARAAGVGIATIKRRWATLNLPD
ncbi:hypothetical protein NBRC3222_2677 [Acetobacter pasteurianus NBRC 3222]|nr:hypothetical protein NBRC3222_2677 [Acetobacter pasteurianus NBRC 3222]